MNKKSLYKLTALLFLGCVFIFVWYIWSEVYSSPTSERQITFEVEEGESAAVLASKLKEAGIIRSTTLFRRYVAWQKLDKKIQAGEFTVEPPVTLARVAQSLRQRQSREEVSLTILPGSTLSDIAKYFSEKGFGTESEFYYLAGKKLVEKKGQVDKALVDKFSILKVKPSEANLEGYLAPETIRVFVEDDLSAVLSRFISHRESQVTNDMIKEIDRRGITLHEVLTLASILEMEVRHPEDMAMVADLFWRRLDSGWALQADSTVKYVSGKDGSVFTTKADRDIDSPWNTYKYAGLPPGPIGTPSIEAITAAIYPEPNDYWYFLTTLDTGEVKYGRNLDEHNRNVQTYLR